MSDTFETLQLIPLFERVALPRRHVIAQHMTRFEDFPAGAVLPDRGPPGCVRFLGSRGLLRSVRVLDLPPLPEHLAGRVDLDPEALLFDSARRRFGGAILPEIGPDSVQLRLVADGPVRVYTLTQEDLREIGETMPWRVQRKHLARLIESLEIARMLGTSPVFAIFDRRERHALASAMVWQSVSVGDLSGSGGGPLGSLAVLGEGSRARIVLEGADLRPIELAYGDIFGVSATLSRLSRSKSFRFHGEVTHAGRAAVLPPFSLAATVRVLPPLFELVRNLAHVLRRGQELVETLAMSRLFAGFPKPILLRMLVSGRAVLWRVGHHPPPVLDLGPGLLLVYDGELLQHDIAPDPTGRSAPLRTSVVASPRKYQLHGEAAFVRQRRASYCLQPRVPTRLIVLPAYAMLEVISRDPDLAFRFIGNALALSLELDAVDVDRRRFEDLTARPKDVALLAPLAPLPEETTAEWLAHALARSITRQFDEPVTVVRLRAEGRLEVRVRRERGDVREVVVGGAGEQLLRAMERGLEEASSTTQALVVLDPSLSIDRVREVVDRVVYINPGAEIRWPDGTEATPYVYTALLAHDAELVDAYGHDCPFPPGTIRLRTKTGYVGGVSPAQMDRWARAVTDRRVGVALGGGGSWGYCHVAVVRALRQLSIPIDMISGTSFGAVVGAYYAHDTEGGMDRLLDQQLWVQAANWGNYVLGVIFERMLDAAFGGRRLEQLDCPFLPVTTDLVTSSQTPLLWGSLGRGVRVSGAYAPILPAVQSAKAMYVDGGMSANVPARVVQHEGARLIISSDAVPPPSERPGLVSVIDAWPVDMLMDVVNLRRRLTAYMAGQQALFKSAGELSASVAPVQFDSNRSVSFAGLLLNGRKIVNNALTDPDFWSALKLAEDNWRAISRPR